MTPEQFIPLVAPGAQAAAKLTGVRASVSVAQAALESAWGSQAPGNNLFGIKADKSWIGSVNYQLTQEVIAGKRTTITSAFRSYPDWAASIADHAKFIRSNPRYGLCFTCKTAEGFASGLQSAGYATDPHYAESLIALIHEHGLDKFDV